MYLRRYRICKEHRNAAAVVLGEGVRRFCQQCATFHKLEAFDEGRRSCRDGLARHNELRRRTSE